MVPRKRARYLAPIALAAAIVATYLVVHASVSSNHAAPSQTTGRRAHKHRGAASARFYVVQPGDNLTSISTRTGISITTLEALNPTVDPNSLQTGQRLRLRR